MQGMSERHYAAHAGVSRGAVQKARIAGRLVLFPDGFIDAPGSDARRAALTDPAKQRPSPTRPPARPRMKPVPEAALSAVGETLREQGLSAPAVGGSTTFLQAKTANEVLKAQERRLKLQKLKGELVSLDRAKTLLFRLAREERDAWVNWPGRCRCDPVGRTGRGDRRHAPASRQPGSEPILGSWPMSAPTSDEVLDESLFSFEGVDELEHPGARACAPTRS